MMLDALMVEDLYAAAHAPKLEAFEKCTEDIKSISPEAYNWVIRSETGHWANTFFGGLRPQKTPQKAAETAVVVQPASLPSLAPTLNNALALNEPTDVEMGNEITPVPISSNPFPMAVIDNDQRIAARQWENLITGVGQRFHSLAEFREALRKYSIAHAFNFVYKKNENQRVTVKCKAEGCPWRIHASKLSTTQLVCIKTMRPTHNCQGVTSKAPFRAKRSWVGNLIKEKVKESPKIKPKDIATELKRDYGIDLNYSQARRAKEYAREQLLGSYKDAYTDGDDGAFPVAFAVVDEENADNWHWFLTELKEIFGGQCYHAYCLGYLAEKLNKDLKGHFSHDARRLMVEDFYAAALSPKLEAFEKGTEDIKSISPEAYNLVIRSEPEHWANTFFGGLRYNHMTSNFGHLFYSWVSEANELPITQMIDELRGKMMQLIYQRRVESSQWITRLTPSMEDKLKNEVIKARSVQVLRSHGSKFEVRYGETVDVVDIENWDCSCKGWLLTGLPCCHAIAVLESYGRSPYDHCSRYFHVETYQLTYADSIHPIPNVERLMDSEAEDGTVLVTPPPTMRTPGRTKIRKVAPGGRIGPSDFLKRQLQCGKCKGLGHNKRSCK
ncbi:PB1 domain-containing protein [Artemisia annua]|uniref:PB1 domain-containing protein n=1 Tax=Artemisia annua TaxID=35608 RepID=A0A2U1MVC3_ARTAN|nr:PB1 domain-containing protein [Artemisia annua]